VTELNWRFLHSQRDLIFHLHHWTIKPLIFQSFNYFLVFLPIQNGLGDSPECILLRKDKRWI
jgi:hypothetical protein